MDFKLVISDSRYNIREYMKVMVVDLRSSWKRILLHPQGTIAQLQKPSKNISTNSNLVKMLVLYFRKKEEEEDDMVIFLTLSVQILVF
jgi:fatty acid-binding protein DegV